MLTDYINKAMSDAVFDKLKEYSVPQIKMLLSEIEHGVKKKISIDIWESL